MRKLIVLILFLMIALPATSQILSAKKLKSDSVQCFEMWELRQIAKSIAELEITRQQLVIKDEIISEYRKKVMLLEPMLAEEQLLNRTLTEELNLKNDKIRQLKKNKFYYIVGGALAGALIYGIIAK